MDAQEVAGIHVVRKGRAKPDTADHTGCEFDQQEQAGVNRRTVSAIANNRRDANPTADVLSRLCAYFNCELGQLAEYVPDEALDDQPTKYDPTQFSLYQLIRVTSRV